MNGKQVGWLRSSIGFYFIQVHLVGHMAPIDQPAVGQAALGCSAGALGLKEVLKVKVAAFAGGADKMDSGGSGHAVMDRIPPSISALTQVSSKMQPCEPYSAFFGFMRATFATVIANFGAAYGTIKSDVAEHQDVCILDWLRSWLLRRFCLVPTSAS